MQIILQNKCIPRGDYKTRFPYPHNVCTFTAVPVITIQPNATLYLPGFAINFQDFLANQFYLNIKTHACLYGKKTKMAEFLINL